MRRFNFSQIAERRKQTHFVRAIFPPVNRIRIRIFIIPINGPTIGANKLHTLIIVIGVNYTYIYKYKYTMFLVGFRALIKRHSTFALQTVHKVC